MFATIVSGSLKAIVWGLAVVGLAGLLLAGMIATPIRQPPELTSVSTTALHCPVPGPSWTHWPRAPVGGCGSSSMGRMPADRSCSVHWRPGW